MRTFAELIAGHVDRAGISDAELARTLGVRRQTIFRWKEGAVARPRHREDVLRFAARLRLTPAERDELLLAAGFAPESPIALPAPELAATPPASAPLPSPATEDAVPALDASSEAAAVAPKPRPARALPLAIALVLLIAVAVFAFVAPRQRYPSALPGETLILIGPFANYAGAGQGYNVAGRLQSAIDRELQAARLEKARVAIWPSDVRDAAAAAAAADGSGAALVIWGEYDAGRVLAHFAVPKGQQGLAGQQIEERLSSPAELPFAINDAVPEEARLVALLTLGQLYVDQGDIDRAHAALTQALARPPQDSSARANLYFWLGYVSQVAAAPRLDEAIDFYTQALALDAGMLAAANNRGIACLRRGARGDPDRAIADLSRIVEDAPEDAIALNNRGSGYLQRNLPGDTRLALADFDRALQVGPDLAAVRYNHALALIREGEGERWRLDLDRALALEPGSANALGGYCWGYLLDGRPDLALPYCEQAVAAENGAMSRDSRAIVYAQLGRTPEAIADLQAFLDWLSGQPETLRMRYEARRRAWLAALQAGQDPFDAQTLRQLRTE